MKYFIYIINCLLVVLIPVMFVIGPTSSDNISKIKTDVEVKGLKSGVFKDLASDNDSLKEESVSSDNESDSNSNDSSLNTLDNKVEATKDKTEVKEEVVSNVVEKQPVSDVLETQVGKMSGYGPDCKGCSGYLASGRYVGDGNIYYNDSKYGTVRIVAGDYSYKMGTIVRVKNSRAGNFIAIVLDRGSSIGFGKKFLFDLLYQSEKDAAKDEVSYNTTFEILRYGY